MFTARTSTASTSTTRSPRLRRGAAVAAVAALVVVTAGACNDSGKSDASEKKDDKETTTTAVQQVTQAMSTTEVLGVDPQFATFMELVDAAELGPVLDDTEKITLFVPSSEAFEALDDGALDELTKSQKDAAAYVGRYISTETVSLSDLVNEEGDVVPTRTGDGLTVEVTGEPTEADSLTISVSGLEITKSDILTSNATVHVLGGAFAP